MGWADPWVGLTHGLGWVDGDRGTALHAQKLRQQRAVVVFEPTAPTEPPTHSANIHGLLSPLYLTTKCDSS